MRILPLLLLLAACPSSDDDAVSQADADDFADRLAGDIADLASTAVDVVDTAEGLQERDTDSACYPTVGTCSFCYAVDGNPLAGEFTFAMEDVPCGAASEVAGRSVNYSVTGAEFSGTWAAAGLGGTYTIEGSGERQSLFATSSPRGGDHEFDSSFSASWTATVSGGVVDTLVLSMTYGDFTGRVWQVEVSDEGEGLSGTASTPDGIQCSVSAGVEAPTVSCVAPGA